MGFRKLLRIAGSKPQNETTDAAQSDYPAQDTNSISSPCSPLRGCKRLLLRPVRFLNRTKKASGTSEILPDMDPNERYEMLKYLGRGSNGAVHLCKDHQLHRLVAVKTVKHPDALHHQREVHILRHLGEHKNITKLLDFFDHPTKKDWMRIVVEYCDIGDLGEYCSKMGSTPIPEHILWVVLRDVAQGLEYMHSRGVVHGDLKLSNVLMANPPNVRDEYGKKPRFPIVKIADFGNATIKPQSDVPMSQYSTWAFCAPESDKYYGPETDVWALGCMIHFMAHRCFPRRAATPAAQQDDDAIFADSDQSDAGDLTEFRKYLRSYVVTPRRLDQMTVHSYPRSKLLNWFMLRALDTDHKTRITAGELNHFVPALTHFVHQLDPMKTYRSMLGMFHEGGGATDSSVVREVVCQAARTAKKYGEEWLFIQAAKLLPILDAVDETAAKQLLEELDSEEEDVAQLTWN